ncbi:MAG: M48 family metallopeptidase [Bacteroidales bacterium]|nr:M48 family metallopeptidase [Bacteroidales bacterium]
MKKFLLIVVFIVACYHDTIAQTYRTEGGQELNISAKVEKSFDNLKNGDKVTFTKMVVTRNDRLHPDDIYLWSGENKYKYKDVINNCSFEYNSIQQFWDTQVLVNVMPDRSIFGYQSELRSEIEEEAISYIYRVKSSGSEFNDPYLESYIYTLVSKIAPCYLIDDRPVNVNLLLLDNPSMNACCFPNGTIVLNTGLLAQLHSEDELVAVLSHEIAHFVMDHTVINIFKEIERQERAQFWASVATAFAAAAEAAIATNNDYYVPGGLTAGVAFASFNIAKSVVKRLGMEYNREQESAADAAAVEVLKLLGYDENAMSTALGRMFESYKADHYYYVINSQSKSHPSLHLELKKVVRQILIVKM